MILYKQNKQLFFASLTAVVIMLISLYVSFNTLNAYSLQKDNVRLQNKVDSLNKRIHENEMAQKIQKKMVMALRPREERLGVVQQENP